MAAITVSGSDLAAAMKEDVRKAVSQMQERPGLAVIFLGEHGAAQVYGKGKTRDCAECGIYSEEYILAVDTPQQELIELIQTLNEQRNIDGILIQLPLPPEVDEQQVIRAIHPEKDMDCFHPVNVGRLLLGEQGLWPCAPSAVIRLLKAYHIPLAGKHCVIVGRSNSVGKPLAMLMLQEDATVTVCHRKTVNLKEKCLQGEILVVAAGERGLITEDMVRPGAVVVDVAMNFDEKGKLCGDVEDSVQERAAYLTPVPGGVGPVTRAVLMEHTLWAARSHGKV